MRYPFPARYVGRFADQKPTQPLDGTLKRVPSLVNVHDALASDSGRLDSEDFDPKSSESRRPVTDSLHGQLLQGLKAIAKAKPAKKPTTRFCFLTGHAFTGKYAQRFHAERAPSAYECGFDPQTVNHVVFDCPRYADVRGVSPASILTTDQAAQLSGFARCYGVPTAPTRYYFS